MMKTLSKAVSNNLDSYVAPKRGEGFEEICLDIFECVLKERGFPTVGEAYARVAAHGVSGDSQGGVDIYDPATGAAAQCKNVANLRPRHLTKELQKLKNFDRPVSHYFFLLGRDGVPKGLEQWVDRANQYDANAKSFWLDIGIEADARPTLHIMGWQEIKKYLFESNFLMWKWGLAHPAIHQYPYLPTLDVAFLAETMDALRRKSDVLPNRRDSKDAVEGLLRSVNVDGLVDLVANEKVEWEVFAGLECFVKAVKEVVSVYRTYGVAVKDVNSQDPIIMEQGFSMMNDLARYLPRLSALGYLREIYRATKKLLNIFSEEESYQWDTEIVMHQGQEIEVEGETTLLFNFNFEDWSHPYYIHPDEIYRLIQIIVNGVRRARADF
ncbi:hypothetical protein [Pseudomonas sp. TWRC1-2]|uniref:hypothetical protein n=1 Tax=Pseudomonas sp. TWRC1-2 TaxID=2804628 RepID=UPI003CF7A882